MSEDTAQSEVELFGKTDNEGTEAATDGASNTQEGEENVKLESGLSDADKQVLAWEKKLESGEKTLEDLKKLPNLKWLVAKLEPKFVKKAKIEEIATEMGLDEALDVKFAERDAQTQDKNLLAEQQKVLQTLDLTKEQRSQLAKEYTELTSYGVPNGKAAQKIALIAQGMVKPTSNPRNTVPGNLRTPNAPDDARTRLIALRKRSGV